MGSDSVVSLFWRLEIIKGLTDEERSLYVRGLGNFVGELGFLSGIAQAKAPGI
jgi:hypothetical protein